MNYYAHSPKDGADAQPYAAHISGVRTLANRYAQEAGRYAKRDQSLLTRLIDGITAYHDLGKLNKKNQKVLSGEETAKSLPVNHVDAGSAHYLGDKEFSALSATVIQAHHRGFPDFSEESNKRELIFRDMEIVAEVDRELPELEAIHSSLIEEQTILSEPESIAGDRSVFLRMLLSCVADADHTDTARHYKKYPDNKNIVQLWPDERLTKLDRCIDDLQGKGVVSERNVLRREMYLACRNADIRAGISSCDSPVGSGKTTAVMAHLLAQAERRGLRRIFVVLPFTNIIRQSVETYRKMLTLPGEKAEDVVAELHHRADFESEDARHLTALWRAPIIVTTAVAFFETLASNSPAALRRLHELSGSAIFVDESHAALPASLLPLAWKWIKSFASDWSCYWVLASGSLSRFWTIPEIAEVSGSIPVPEIVAENIRNRLSVYEKKRIVYRSELSPKSTSELAEWIISFPGPRLVILNTIQSAAVLADFFAEKYGRAKVEHLSTSLTPKDRESTLKRVKMRLKIKTDDDLTLIATSCVEAGVDLSLKTGFRELGSLSSLLQAAGRVNREGGLADGEIWTFCIMEDGMLRLNPGLKQAGTVLRGYLERGIAITPQLTTTSIADEIALYGLSGKHKKLVSYEERQDFRCVERDFKVIDSDTRIAVVDDGMAERLRYGAINWHELQKASVQIAKHKLIELKAPCIIDDIYRWNLEYDNFLGYMAGIVKLKKYSGAALII